MATINEKIRFFELEFNAEITAVNGIYYATLKLFEEPPEGEHTKEMEEICNKVSSEYPEHEGYIMGSPHNYVDKEVITFKLT